MSTTHSTSIAEAASAPDPVAAPKSFTLSPEVIALACLFIAAFLVRLWPVWQVHFWDEAVYLQNAEAICCGKTNYSELSSRPPLLSLLFAGIFRIWHHAYAASVFTAILNALAPLFLYLGGRKLVGRTAAAVAALLLAFSPFFISGTTGNSLLTDSPALTLILISLWLSFESTERPAAVWGALAGLFSALAVLMRFASLPVVAMFSLLMFRSERWFRAAVRFAVGFAIPIVPYLLWSRIRYGGFLFTLKQGWQNVAGSSEPPSYYLQHFFDVFPWVAGAGLLLWFVAWILDRRARPSTTFVPSLGSDAFLWVWALVVFAYFSSITHKELRYILPLAPAVFLLAGRGLAVLARPMNMNVRAIGLALLMAGLAYTFAPDLARFRSPFVSPFISEEKEVSDFLNSKARAGAVLYTNFNSPVFGYYTLLPTKVLTEQDATFYKVFPNNMPSDGYLILYNQIDKEPRQDWVESNPSFQRFQEFPSLTVYEYRAGTK